MKRITMCTIGGAVLIFLFAGKSGGQGRFGAGMVFGKPTGIAINYRINNRNAVDGAIGFGPEQRFRFHLDYLWKAYPFESENLSVHYGLGPAFAFGTSDYVLVRGNTYLFRSQNPGFALRVPVGLTYTIPRSPLDTFIEIAPLFIFAPASDIGFDAGIGLRVYP
jgi:hypothetical protein